MKLSVEKGELTLPDNFSFEVEQHNAFFSEEGSQSIPATIPATPSDQAKLGFPCRLGRRNRFVNAFPAILSHGAFEKAGTLLVSSADSRSITCSLAVEASDFYSRYKDRPLREIFAEKVLTTYSTPSAWYTWLFSVYTGAVDSDFRVFPVAVNYDAEHGYQLNNEPVETQGSSVWPLAHEVRLVREGEDEVSVPDGYGIAPYLKLWKFLEYIFTLNGYTVGRNCFRTDSRLSGLVLLHNCADVICNGKIDYSDLVPDVAVSDILEWMNSKFHAQIAVHPAQKAVDILLLESILTAPFDDNLTGQQLERLTYSFSRSSRVVMTPSTSIEGAEPAADTLQALLEKYGSAKACTESEFYAVSTPCLVLRLATGTYYEVHIGYRQAGRTGQTMYKKVAIGSNQMRYDRQNAEGSEEFSPADVIAPMVAVSDKHIVAPYVGSRIHRNTSYNGKEEDDSQAIIIADYAGLSVSSGASSWADGKYYYATTQKYDNIGEVRPGKIGLSPEELIREFFHLYGTMLLNNTIQVSGEFLLSASDLMSFNMYAPKLLDGQTLLPTYLRYEVGKQTRCLELRCLLIKEFDDGQEDVPIVFPEPEFEWAVNLDEINARKAELQAEHDDGTVIWEYDEEDPYVVNDKDIFLPSPRAAGLESEHVDRLIHFILRKPQGAGHVDVGLETDTLQMWFDSVAVVS